ncbi:hypothetical protein [Rhodanobacter geophilus]|uniref:Uncharacterized protein n=1 Tax=Rhodanobacter geophilus TaxID=3162488 RepID=A0ABV3QQ01_9GAMM
MATKVNNVKRKAPSKAPVQPAKKKASTGDAVSESFKYLKRHTALRQIVNETRLDLAELQAWSDAEGMRINFHYCLKEFGRTIPDEGHVYFPVPIIAGVVARIFVQNNLDADGTLKKVAESGNAMLAELEPSDAMRAYIAVMEKVGVVILEAVYDGKLRLYDYIGIPVDVTYHRMAYEEKMAATVPGESPKERRERIKARKTELIASGVIPWLQTLAAEEGLSVSGVKKLLR